MATESAWRVLSKVFGADKAAFRHRMGLFESPTQTFYAPTADSADIRREKEALIRSPTGDLYLLETSEGAPLFAEFLECVGWRSQGVDAGLGGRMANRTATLSLEPDYLLMAEPDWRLVWASVCAPTRWSLVGKAGLPLRAVHEIVPGLNEELGRKINAFFDRQTPGEGWGRANWGFTTSATRNQHPSLRYVPLNEATSIGTVFLRLEVQNLVRLQRTGGVVFGIRVSHFPLLDVLRRPGIAVCLKEQLRTMPPVVAAYKGIPNDFWQRLEPPAE